MHSIDVRIAHAFMDGEDGGNPAGIVLDADGLSEAAMQAVATRVGLSETAFVSRSRIATRRLMFFTPTRRIAHCGHATVASFALLAERRELGDGEVSHETVDGVHRIVLDGGSTFLEQAAPSYRPTPVSPARIMGALGVHADALADDADPMVVSTGLPFLLVPMRDVATLAAVRPNAGALEVLSEDLDLVGVYAFTDGSTTVGRHATARMFAPRYGIAEEAATGMAAGPLAAYLHDVAGVQDARLWIEQGTLMPAPSPSLLEVRLDVRDGRVAGLMVGGRARQTGRVRVTLDAA